MLCGGLPQLQVAVGSDAKLQQKAVEMQDVVKRDAAYCRVKLQSALAVGHNASQPKCMGAMPHCLAFTWAQASSRAEVQSDAAATAAISAGVFATSASWWKHQAEGVSRLLSV